MATAAISQKESGKSTSRFYRPELDILRFAAFSMVFLYHTDNAQFWARWGILGVPVFFLLSAFLITELLLREKDTTGTVHVRSFYVRRMLRIWPLYFAALLFGFLFIAPVAHQYHVSWVDLVCYLLLVGNWRTPFNGFLPGGLGPLWSICVEEQFYLLWPLLARKVGRRGILYAAGLMWLTSQISIVALRLHWHLPFVAIWTNTFTNLQYFALGAAFSVLLRGRTPGFSPWTRAGLGMAALGLFLCSGVLIFGNHGSAVGYLLSGLLLAGIAASLLFFGLLGARLPHFTAPAVYLGKVSYGLYVMHDWVWVIAGGTLAALSRSHHAGHLERYAVTIPVLLAVVTLSYHYFEKPFLRLKTRFEFVKSRAA